MPVEINDARFGEFEEFSEAFRDTGWESDYLQLERGRFRGRMLFSGLGQCQIARCSWARQIRHHGLQPKGSISFGVTLSQQGGIGRFMGAPIGLDDVIVQGGESELEVFAAPRWDAAVFTIPDTDLAEQVAALTQGAPEVDLRRRAIASLPGSQSARLRRACQAYFSAVEAALQAPDRHLPLEEMAGELLSLAVHIVVDSQIAPQPEPRLRQRVAIIREAEEYVRSGEKEALRVPDLCRHVGVSERTLRYAFADLVGVSPAAYLKTARLNWVHDALSNADPAETLVKSVAYAHGFWHLGQFCQDYRRLFGVRPSETLTGYTCIECAMS